MRLVHVIGGGEFGGAERYVLNLVTGLDGNVFEPMVACGYEGRLSRALRGAGYRVWVLPSGVRGLFALARLLRSVDADLVHTHGVRGNLFGRVAARYAGVPTIVTTVHSHLSLDYPAPLKRVAYRTLDGLTDPLVTRYVVVSKALRDLAVQRGIKSERITVIPNGVDTEAFRPAPGAGQRLRAHLGVDAGTRLVGMAARMHPVKGHDLFLRAAARVVATGGAPDFRFLVIGSGPPEYRRELEALSDRLGLASHVLFLGEKDDMADLLAGLDVAVVPSQFEGFSLAVIEAMASGVPVVATRVGAIPEIIVHGENGLLSQAGDAADLAAGILSVLADSDLARRLAAQGLETAQRYSLEKFTRRMSDFYLSLLRGRAR